MNRSLFLTAFVGLSAVAQVVAPLPDASLTRRGAVSTGAQSFSGVKTFDGGVNIDGDLTVDGGVYVGDGAGTTASPPLAFRAVPGTGFSRSGTTGINWSINGTFRGLLYSGGADSRYYGPGNPALVLTSTTAQLTTLTNGLTLTGSTSASLTTAGTLDFSGTNFTMTSAGLESFSGTDSSGSPGAATINKPRGISAIAIGASTVTITNSLATTSSWISVTPLSLDATCRTLSVTTRSAGSFVVSCVANATAATKFAWEVGGII